MVLITKKEVIVYFLFLFLIAFAWAFNQDNTSALAQKLEDGKKETNQSALIERNEREPIEVIYLWKIMAPASNY